jgi:hypothetical protein
MIKASSQFKDLLNMALNLPENFDGTPLRVSTIEKTPFGFKSYQVLSAYKILKINYNKDDFKPLSGYKEVQSQSSMMVADQN